VLGINNIVTAVAKKLQASRLWNEFTPLPYICMFTPALPALRGNRLINLLQLKMRSLLQCKITMHTQDTDIQCIFL
jgi:hypothetical protein